MTTPSTASSASNGSQNTDEHSRQLRRILLACALGAFTLSIAAGLLLPGKAITAEDVARHIAQSAIVTIGAALPIGMYYHFVQTRHNLIKREFRNNLARLGMRYQDFEERFDAVYGGLQKLSRTNAPVILATVIMIIGWWLVFYPPLPPDAQQATAAQPAGTPQSAENAAAPQSFVKPNLTPLAFGFLGAYTMIIGSLARRYLTDDLKPKAFVTTTWDVLLVWTIVWTVSQIRGLVDVGAAPAIYFFLGTSPEVGVFLIQAIGTASLGLRPGSHAEYPPTHIQGLNFWNRKRLREEGVESVEHLATADIVDLLLKTRFPPERIVDWIDQALLQFHLKPRKKQDEKQTTQPGGAGLSDEARAAYAKYAGLNLVDPMEGFLEAHIRTATDLLYICDHTDLGNPKLVELAKLVNPTFGLDFLVATLRQDPNIAHVRHWREHEDLAIAETAEKTLMRAKAGLEDAGQSRSDQAKRASYERAIEGFTKTLELHKGKDVFIDALMGRARANAGVAELLTGEPRLQKLVAALGDYDEVVRVDVDELQAWDARLERARLVLEHSSETESLKTDAYIPGDLNRLLEYEKYQTTENYLLYYDRVLTGMIDLTLSRDTLTRALSKATDDKTRAAILLRRATLIPGDADYRQALALDPDNPEVYRQLGESYMKDRQYDRAVEVYGQWKDRLADTSEWKGFACEQLGEAHQARGDYAKAISAYEEAQRCPIDIMTFPGVNLDHLAECYEALGEFDKFIRVYEGIGNPIALARAYRKAGKIEQAREQLRRSYAQPSPGGASEEGYRFELAMIEACDGNSEKATRDLIADLIRQPRPDRRSLIDKVEQELKSNAAVAPWIRHTQAGFQRIEVALDKGVRFSNQQAFAKAFRAFEQAAQEFAGGCPASVLDWCARTSPKRWLQDYFEQLIEAQTWAGGDPWTVLGLMLAKTEAHQSIANGLSGIGDLRIVDDFGLLVALKEDSAYQAEPLLQCIWAAAESKGFSSIAEAIQDESRLTLMLRQDAFWENHSPQTSTHWRDMLWAFMQGEAWSRAP